MIKKEFYKTREDNVKLYRTYSDEGYKIIQIETGNIYNEAIDVEDKNYIYQETDEKIETQEETTEEIQEENQESAE